MYMQEEQRQTHLIILFSSTVLMILLTGESILLGWEISTVALLLLGLVAGWAAHITERIPAQIRLWIYFSITMLGYFFYGLHETSIYDLAPVMICIILVYSTAEINLIINLCVATYYLTIIYDLVFVLKGTLELTGLTITRTLLHLLLVYMAGMLTRLMFKKRREERKNLESRITKLEEINHRTEDFMVNVSHELRTPINAVTGLTAVMLKNEKDADQRKNILSIQLAGHRLFNQIEDILDYTEIDAGRLKVREDTYTITSVIHDVINGKYLLEREHALELIFDIDAGVPSILFGDSRKIKKIIQHLTDNAVKFTKKGGVYVRIYAVRKAYGVNLCIKVRDTGIGIDEENLEKITEKFFQTNEGRNRSSGGLGLGLSIVSEMVSAMEGFIQIKSTRDVGTAVSVSIPQKVSDDSPCMAVNNRSDLCVACYLKLEKFEVPKVRYYYNKMISHMVKGLNVPLHRVSDFDDLKALNARYQLTHLITAREEYEENASYFEYLDKSIEVIVVADDSFVPPPGSRIKVSRKPFNGWSIVHKLNTRALQNADSFETKRMICPGVSVLVVDDEPMNLMVAEGLFQDYQMDVKTAQSGMEAIELCRKEAFDLIFLDHMMPEMDGVATLKHLRKIHMETDNVHTVIAFTANASSSAKEMLLREGFNEFLSKPIEHMELERVLREVLPKSAIRYLENDQNTTSENPTKQLSERSIREARMTRLEDLGVHTRSGMQYCRDDMKFYEELLVKFAQNEEHKILEIGDSFDREDLEQYRILVHALKSSAKMVGADSLSEMAKRLEDAAKSDDTDYIKAHHGALLDQYRMLSQGILQVFDPGKNIPVQTTQGDGTELSKAELVQQLTLLKGKLETFEAEGSEALLSQMGKAAYQGILVRELLSGIWQDVDEFEFSAASEKAEALLRRIEGGEA